MKSWIKFSVLLLVFAFLFTAPSFSAVRRITPERLAPETTIIQEETKPEIESAEEEIEVKAVEEPEEIPTLKKKLIVKPEELTIPTKLRIRVITRSYEETVNCNVTIYVFDEASREYIQIQQLTIPVAPWAGHKFTQAQKIIQVSRNRHYQIKALLSFVKDNTYTWLPDETIVWTDDKDLNAASLYLVSLIGELN